MVITGTLTKTASVAITTYMAIKAILVIRSTLLNVTAIPAKMWVLKLHWELPQVWALCQLLPKGNNGHYNQLYNIILYRIM